MQQAHRAISEGTATAAAAAAVTAAATRGGIIYQTRKVTGCQRET